MRIINKKYLLIILLIGVILTSVVILKPTKEVKLDNVILKQEVNNKTFAMYTETDNGYKEYEGNSFPKGQRLNKDLSKCIDKNGEEIEDAINVDNKSGNISVKSNKSFSCYLYFDNKIKDLSGNGNIAELHDIKVWTEEGIHTYNDGTNSGYILLKFNNNFETNTFTIITRVRVASCNSDDNYCYLISLGDPGRFEAIIYHKNDSMENVIGTGGNVFNSNSIRWIYSNQQEAKKLLYNEWGTLISRYDGNTFSLYIDGEKVAESESVLEDSLNRLNSVCIGSTTLGNLAPDATFSDVLIFDSALSEEEINKYFSGTIDKDKVINTYVKNNESAQNLLLYYKFN